MDYEHYKVEDFLLDEEFKRWVMTPDAESEIFWNNWLASHPGQKETLLKAREVLLSLDFQVLMPDEHDQDEVLQNILKGGETERSNGNKGRFMAKIKQPLIRLAGVFLVLLLTIAIYNSYKLKDPVETSIEKFITKSNPRGQKSQISLPDGTVLWLNSESEVSYPISFGEQKRNLKLKGEAFFEVAKDKEKPFTVLVNDIEVVALGTSFNINAFPENQSVTVALVTGKVLVKETLAARNTEKPHFKDIILIPGESLSYDLNDFSIEKSFFDFSLDISWKEGTIIFNNASYEEVKSTLERWFNVKIAVSNNVHKEWQFSGEFKRESLDRILEHIGFIESFKFQKRGNEITITYTN